MVALYALPEMNKQAVSLTALLVLLATVAVIAFRIGVESVEPEPCNVPDPDWELYQACYERDRLIDTPEGGIWFWRLNDSNRSAVGGFETPSAAALVLGGGRGNQKLLKAYCPNGCWVAGNGDPLPEILKIDENRYAVWSPNDRASHRHGADGHIEILDMRYLSLSPLGKELTIGWDHDRALSLREYQGCQYIVVQALEFFTPEYTVPAGYIIAPYPHFQPLEEGCPAYTYNGDVDPETVIPDLKNKLENAEIL